MSFQITHLSRNGEKFCLGLILFSALLMRAWTVITLEIAPVSDYAGYDHMAFSLLTGNGLVDSLGNFALMSAGYPLFVLAPVYALFGHHFLAAQLANALLGMLSVWLTYSIAREAGAGKLGRLIGAIIFALYLPSWIYAEYLAKENLMTPLMLGVVLLSLRCMRNSAAKTEALLGITLGLLAITGSAGLAVAPVTVIAVMISPLSLPQKLARLGLVGLIAMLVLTPWLIRNYRVVGAPVLNTNGGFNLYLGNNPAANGLFVSIADTPRGANWENLRKGGEVFATTTLKNDAIAWIKQNPYEFLTLSMKKFLLFWMPPIHEGKGPQSKAESMARMVWLAQYLLICASALVGVAYKQLRTRDTCLLWLAIFGYAAVHMIFYVIFRYREPIMPLLIVLAALTIERAIQSGRWQGKESRSMI